MKDVVLIGREELIADEWSEVKLDVAVTEISGDSLSPKMDLPRCTCLRCHTKERQDYKVFSDTRSSCTSSCVCFKSVAMSDSINLIDGSPLFSLYRNGGQTMRSEMHRRTKNSCRSSRVCFRSLDMQTQLNLR